MVEQFDAAWNEAITIANDSKQKSSDDDDDDNDENDDDLGFNDEEYCDNEDDDYNDYDDDFLNDIGLSHSVKKKN